MRILIRSAFAVGLMACSCVTHGVPAQDPYGGGSGGGGLEFTGPSPEEMERAREAAKARLGALVGEAETALSPFGDAAAVLRAAAHFVADRRA